jgi:hypothetical protein
MIRAILSFILVLFMHTSSYIIYGAIATIVVVLWIPLVIVCVILKLALWYKRRMQFLFVSTSLGANARIII